ncbi:hypothetical protein [Natronococcus occultus]|uniref:Carboxypeptidase regulatory-like domain-containing protein n=1 Tax=Natronococcus occultus SP4 TaxID=694430 RepID=L0JSN6_9EURY|nr:hypothetical protein [Natronococcus occultus]AGB36022.1 hypothetical protein Natoc_0142 [Natronococcus occultus SP4]
MHRRSLLGATLAVPLAGCSAAGDLFGEDGVDETLEDEHTAEFSAEEGEKFVAEIDVERVENGDAVSVQVAKIGEGPLEARSVSDTGSFDVTIEESGDHVVTVTNGAAHVTLEKR